MKFNLNFIILVTYQVFMIRQCYFVLLVTLGCCVQINSLNSQCLCDISDVCDYECCCDGDCSNIIIQQLQQYGKCDDDGFGIPWCAGLNQTDINIKGMYSGLNTIYTIIKRLFCVNRVNIVDVPAFYTSEQTSSNIDTYISQIDSDNNQITAQSPQIASLNVYKITGAFLMDPLGICQKTNQIPSMERMPQFSAFSSCRTFIDVGDITNHPIASVQNLLTDSSFKNLKIYDMSQPTTDSPTIKTSYTPSCVTGYCSNVLRLLKIYLTPEGNVNTQYSYAFVGETKISEGENGYIDIKYSYQYLNSDGTLAKTSSEAYLIGSKLNLLKEVSSVYKTIPNPINLSYRIRDNECKSAAESADNSFVAFQFGKDAQYGCLGTTSLIYENLKESFNYVGKFGAVTTSLEDYVAVSWPDIDPTSSVRVVFNYIKVGSADFWQYYIMRVNVGPVQSISGEQSLYIEYIEVPNEITLYVPEPPQVDTYLPNDFLYPFYVAG